MKTKVRETPRISVNKLGEYLAVKAGRRRSILKDQKFPKDFLVPRYTEATAAMIRCVTEEDDGTLLSESISDLRGATPGTKWELGRTDSCIEALQSFEPILVRLNQQELEALSDVSAQTGAILVINGLEISIRPEILVRRTSTKPAVGYIKFYTVKGHQLDQDGRDYISTLIYQYALKEFGDEVDPKLCFLIDVFGQTISQPPKAFKQRMKDIEAACSEIVQLWSGIQE